MKKIQLKLKFRYLLTLMFIFFLTFNSFSQVLEKTIVKTTRLASDVEVYISNAFRSIEVKIWDKNELKVEYKIYVEAKSEKDLTDFNQKLNSELDNQFKNIKNNSIDISFPFSKVQMNFRKIEIKIRNRNQTHYLTKFKASMIVYAPNKNYLNIKQNYGKLSIEDTQADVSLEISSNKLEMGNCKSLKLNSSFSKNIIIGNTENAEIDLRSSDIEMGEIKNNLNLKASFSSFKNTKIGNNAELNLRSSKFETTDVNELTLNGSFIRHFKVNNIDKASINLNSSEFEANKINSLKINSASFSKFKINKVNVLNLLSSKSSKFNIINANKVKAPDCSFSDFNINNLKTSFTNTARSGSVKLLNVSSGFSKINIDGQFVSINIIVEENTEYKVSANLQFPQYKFNKVNIENIEKKERQEIFKGWKGNKNAKSEIIFNCKTCNIKLN